MLTQCFSFVAKLLSILFYLLSPVMQVMYSVCWLKATSRCSRKPCFYVTAVRPDQKVAWRKPRIMSSEMINAAQSVVKRFEIQRRGQYGLYLDAQGKLSAYQEFINKTRCLVSGAPWWASLANSSSSTQLIYVWALLSYKESKTPQWSGLGLERGGPCGTLIELDRAACAFSDMCARCLMC